MTSDAVKGSDSSSADYEHQSNEADQFEMHVAASDANILDEILVRIGEFGRYQMFNYILLCIPMIFNAFQSISYVFTASPVVYRFVIMSISSIDNRLSS